MLPRAGDVDRAPASAILRDPRGPIIVHTFTVDSKPVPLSVRLTPYRYKGSLLLLRRGTWVTSIAFV